MAYPQKEFIQSQKIIVPETGKSKFGFGNYIYKDHTFILNTPIRQGAPLVDQFIWNKVMVEKNERIYVWGHLTYLDVFDSPHYTNYCLTFGPDEIKKGRVGYCVDYNDAN